MPRDKATIQAEIDALTAKAKARRGKTGFGENVREIDARLTACREELASAGD